MKIHILRHDDNETPHLSREDAIAELRRGYDDPSFSEMPVRHEVGTDEWLADVAEWLNVVVYITEHDLGPVEVLITGHPGTGFNFYGPFPKGQSWDFAGYFDFAFSDELMDVNEATGTTYVLNDDNVLEDVAEVLNDDPKEG